MQRTTSRKWDDLGAEAGGAEAGGRTGMVACRRTEGASGMADDPPELLLPDAAAWRAWLLAHHGSAHTGTPCTGSGPSSRTTLPT